MVQNTRLGGGRTLIDGTGYDIKLQIGTLLSEIPVGNTVKIAVNGTMRDWLVVNQGIPSGSTLYDDSCNGTWLLMRDCYEKRQWNNRNDQNISNSTIFAYLDGTFFNLFDAGIRSIIKQVKIPYCAGSSGSSVFVGEHGLSRRIFLLSCYEVGWTKSTSNYIPDDGAKLDYFSAKTNASSTAQDSVAYLDGTAVKWWLRSASSYDSGYVWYLSTSGAIRQQECIDTSVGVRPAMILPFETLVADDGTVLA